VDQQPSRIVAGRLYPARPPYRGSMPRQRRYREIVEALRFAVSRCSESERRLYLQLLQSLASAENLVDSLGGLTLQATDLMWTDAAPSSPFGSPTTPGSGRR
jgi:hypothetical protein